MLGLSDTVIPGQNPYSVEFCKIGGVFQEIKAYSFVTWWSFWLISSRFDVCTVAAGIFVACIAIWYVKEPCKKTYFFIVLLLATLLASWSQFWSWTGFKLLLTFCFNFHPFWRMVSSFIALNLFLQILEFDEAADNSSEGMEVEYEVQKQETWLRWLRRLLALSER